jgi:predicted ATPase
LVTLIGAGGIGKTQLGLDLTGGVMSAERIGSALAAKQLMLVLDNCEHVIDAAASTAGALLRASSAARGRVLTLKNW